MSERDIRFHQGVSNHGVTSIEPPTIFLHKSILQLQPNTTHPKHRHFIQLVATKRKGDSRFLPSNDAKPHNQASRGFCGGRGAPARPRRSSCPVIQEKPIGKHRSNGMHVDLQTTFFENCDILNHQI